MTASTTRRHAGVLHVIGAAVVGLIMYLVLSAAPFYPTWLASIIALAAAALALSSPALASPVLVVAVALPLAAADVTVGATTLVTGLATAWLLRGEGPGFLLVAPVTVAVPLHAEWALAPLAGYLLGRRAGADVGIAACLVIEGSGLCSLDSRQSVAPQPAGHRPGSLNSA